MAGSIVNDLFTSRAQFHDMTDFDFKAAHQGRPQSALHPDPGTIRSKPFPIDLKIEMPDLEKGVGGGCESCTLLLDGLKHVFSSLKVVESLLLKSTEPRSVLVVWAVFRDKQRKTEYLEFYTHEKAPSKWPIIGAGRDVSVDSSSDACMRLAESFVKACVETHKQCHRLSRPVLPTRVVNVGSDDENPWLYETKGECYDYAALSHCWGQGSNPVITTKQNLEDRKALIPFVGLPKTFQDAIKVVRSLGIPHLWIDSLCIIQDSEEDWAKEATRLGSVYTNALVTVAADGSDDSSGGCFVGKGRLATLARLDCSGPKGYLSVVHVRYQGIRPDSNSISHTKSLHPRSKLTTRGWVLQERLLSPRTLHFTTTEMAWECATQIRCECRVIPEPAATLNFKGRYIRSYVRNGASNVPSFNWYDVVEEFTRRDLTYQRDRLAALSGIAATTSSAEPGIDYANLLETYSTVHIDQDAFSLPLPADLAESFAQSEAQPYVAGLWDDDMEIGLLWYVEEWIENRRYSSKRQEEYIAPSWSWASITGPVKYIRDKMVQGEENFQQMLGMEEVKCVPATQNIFGSVARASIKTAGLVVPVRLYKMEHGADKEMNRDPKNSWLVISERDFRNNDREYFHTESDIRIRTEPQFQFINHDRSSSRSNSSQSLDNDAEPINDRDFSVVNTENVHILKSSRIEMPRESPYDMLRPDVRGDGYEIDAKEPYLLLLVGYEYDAQRGQERKKRAYGLVVRQEPGNAGRWQRIGLMVSRFYWWSSWQRVASPYSLTLV